MGTNSLQVLSRSVQSNKKKLEMVKGEFAGKSTISRATKEDDVDAGIPIDLDADDNYLPGTSVL